MEFLSENAHIIIPIVVVIIDAGIAYLTKDSNDSNDKYIPLLRNVKKLIKGGRK